MDRPLLDPPMLADQPHYAKRPSTRHLELEYARLHRQSDQDTGLGQDAQSSAHLTELPDLFPEAPVLEDVAIRKRKHAAIPPSLRGAPEA